MAGKLSGLTLYVAEQISCTSSRSSVARYAELIQAQGARLTRRQGEADILLVDTCAYSRAQEERSLAIIEKNERAAKEGAKVIVCGCLAAINPRELQKHYHGEFFSPRDERQLAYILGLDDEDARFVTAIEPRGRLMGRDYEFGVGRRLALGRRAKFLLHAVDHRLPLHRVPALNKILAASQAWSPRAYALTISQGCLGNCSFCVIPLAKGRTVSLPAGMIVEKIREAARHGARKIILTSEDTGAYGADLGTSFVELLERLHEIPERCDFAVLFFDPRWLRAQGDRLVEILRRGRVRAMQIPLQSGSNQMLASMRRCYRVEHVMPYLARMRAELPHVALSTQIIAGFPGETATDFEASRAIVTSGIFDYVDIFDYSHREGADSTTIPGHLPEPTVRARGALLRRDWRRAKWRGRLRDLTTRCVVR